MSIPVPILAACAGLVLLFAVFLVRMLREGARTLSALRRLDHILRSVTPADGNARRDGLDGGTLSQVRERCSHLPEPMRGWWRRIEDNLLSYTAPAGREG